MGSGKIQIPEIEDETRDEQAESVDASADIAIYVQTNGFLKVDGYVPLQMYHCSP